MNEEALRQHLRELEVQVRGQAREIRALERIEVFQDCQRQLEGEIRSLREQIGELHTFLSLTQALSTTLNPEELFRLTPLLIGRLLQVEAYSMLLLDEVRERLSVKTGFGLPGGEGEGPSLRLGEGISGLVAQTGQATLVPDIRAESRCLEQRWFQLQRGSFLCVPLRIKGGKIIGVLNAMKPEPHGFTPGDLDLFQAVANTVGAALENAQLFQRTKELSSRDPLTGLFNRRQFFEVLEKEVQRAGRYQRALSLLMVDVDHFKQFNDTYGHLQGDEVLRMLAHLLLANTRRADMVSRYGGEEFVVLLPEINRRRAVVVAEKIRAAVAEHPFPGRMTQPGGRLTVTIGAASYPADAQEALQLVDLADRAMYLGKERGRNCVDASPEPRHDSPQEP